MFSLLRLPRPLLRQAVRKKLACGAAAPQWHHLDLVKHCAAPFPVKGGQGEGGPFRPPPKRLYYSTKERKVNRIFGDFVS